MKPRHITLLLLPLLVALCSAWGPSIIKGPCPSVTVSGAFSPDSLTNLVFWVDVYSRMTNSSGNPITGGDEVNQWWSKAGVTNSYFTNYAGLNKGLFYDTVGGPTNGPIVKQVYAANHLVFSTNTHWAQPNTYFIVYMNNSTATTRYYLTSTNSSYANSIYESGNPSKLQINAGSNVTAPENAGVNSWKILTVVFSGAASYVRTNGALFFSGDAGTQSTTRPSLGYPSAANGPFAAVEWLMCNAEVSSNQIFQMEQYLSRKHHITNSILNGL